MATPNGIVLDVGASLLPGGAPTVTIATGLSRHSANPKVGPDAITVWILHGTLDPVEALRLRADDAVCGSCVHRDGTCYVITYQAPLQVFRSWKAGQYLDATRLPFRERSALVRPLFRGRFVRFGGYGDPAAIPVGIWEELLSECSDHTGYTHQWQDAPDYRPFLMASVDTPFDYCRAREAGWRTFRVRKPGEPLLPGEFGCPASLGEGLRLTCQQCRACDGITHSPRAACPSVVYHATHTPPGFVRVRRFAQTSDAAQCSRRTFLSLL
jgi:hypothetical protein